MSPLLEARRRIDALREELAELEQFVEMYRRLSASAQQDDESVENSDTKSVDKFGRHGVSRRSTATTQIISIIENLIRDVGRPMTRSELVAPLEARDVHIAGADKARYLGTILWRNRHRFHNLPGHGYWLKELPFPLAGYVPAFDNENQFTNENGTFAGGGVVLTEKIKQNFAHIKLKIEAYEDEEMVEDLSPEDSKRLNELKAERDNLIASYPDLLSLPVI